MRDNLRMYYPILPQVNEWLHSERITRLRNLALLAHVQNACMCGIIPSMDFPILDLFDDALSAVWLFKYFPQSFVASPPGHRRNTRMSDQPPYGKAGTCALCDHFVFLTAMNTCPCGYHGDPVRECTCSMSTVTRYQEGFRRNPPHPPGRCWTALTPRISKQDAQ
jgi:hypothetical protein